MTNSYGTDLSDDDIRPNSDAPEVVVQRLPLYVRVLAQFDSAGAEMVSSEQLGTQLQMTPAQIRKDLSYFGRFGKQGRGYNVKRLALELRSILGLDRQWNAGLVGVGRLGRAIIAYPGFRPEGFRIIAAFDADPSVVGSSVGDIDVRPIDQIKKTVSELGIQIGIVAVPATNAQAVFDALVEAEVKAILNYAPVAPQVPLDVKVRGVDPVLALQSMTYFLKPDNE
ncbi:MAG: redox-sensing transcriptional repressor Rex [Chloroflexi bacterium]|jgi:redox-sensing transcriptional repressor|nr:redox-sensing transcriptional repressor Rex [Chloroflexota bacterium]MBT4073100.1 redox-sensing transcriptional repressor Rex [Chloroflexota bacterium]MBT4515043.1 redox-sensing transcriptional repressor Rex [Chloroflexota bacterium]MBT6680460.1 redox-sensing transcriptional repressor Rex [Chloroflexota bacterium]